MRTLDATRPPRLPAEPTRNNSRQKVSLAVLVAPTPPNRPERAAAPPLLPHRKPMLKAVEGRERAARSRQLIKGIVRLVPLKHLILTMTITPTWSWRDWSAAVAARWMRWCFGGGGDGKSRRLNYS